MRRARGAAVGFQIGLARSLARAFSQLMQYSHLNIVLLIDAGHRACTPRRLRRRWLHGVFPAPGPDNRLHQLPLRRTFDSV